MGQSRYYSMAWTKEVDKASSTSFTGRRVKDTSSPVKYGRVALEFAVGAVNLFVGRQ
ncbi:UNVERIFIED_CONTAM: hypothetical protein Sradi_3232700 [Sesamum radiatum]|uniref:Uncharacterized protein n=1 Tax=Sesamum radiatum TaxID=300843 RepID=A0AAW2RGB0_SESRA